MKSVYIIGHWGLTLLLSPFASKVIEYICGPNPHQVVTLLEVYPITLLFSIAFSLPTFFVYIICFHFLSKQVIHITMSKALLITVSVLGIYLTLTLIEGTMSQDIIIAYSVTAIIVGLILRLRKSKIKTKDNLIAP